MIDQTVVFVRLRNKDKIVFRLKDEIKNPEELARAIDHSNVFYVPDNNGDEYYFNRDAIDYVRITRPPVKKKDPLEATLEPLSADLPDTPKEAQ